MNYEEIIKTISNIRKKYKIQENLIELNQCSEYIKITNDYLLEKYSNLLLTNNCSLHVRRGDYLKSNGFHPTQSIEYYKQSVSTIGEDVNYLIFSDDIEWCKQNLDFITNKTYINNNLLSPNLPFFPKIFFTHNTTKKNRGVIF